VNEDQITEALFGTLNACEPETIGRFLAEVAGVHLSSAHFTVGLSPERTGTRRIDQGVASSSA